MKAGKKTVAEIHRDQAIVQCIIELTRPLSNGLATNNVNKKKESNDIHWVGNTVLKQREVDGQQFRFSDFRAHPLLTQNVTPLNARPPKTLR